MIACATTKSKAPLVNSIYLAFNAINIGYSATNKTRIRNTYFLLDEKPNYNSGKILNIYSLTFPNSPYTFTIPKFIKKVEILSFSIDFTDTYVVVLLLLYVNNLPYQVGVGWTLCSDYNNMYCSPIQNKHLNITESDLNFETSNTLSFLFQNSSSTHPSMQIWLILKEFKFSFTYRTK